MTDTSRVGRAGLHVAAELAAFIDREALPGSGVAPDAFWDGLAALVADFGPRNAELLQIRADLQATIDRWHLEHPGRPDGAEYRAMLSEIGYLVPPGPSFTIDTDGVDPEIAEVAGPQLVVPVTNARYALNAANARWGSFYDALYGTDAIGDPSPPGPYDPERGGRVIAWVRQFLDDVAPLDGASHADAVAYRVVDGELAVARSAGGMAGLADPASFAGHRGDASAPSAVLLEHHGLGIEIVIDREHPVGRDDPAGVADVVLESAVTAIIDCEDSVAAVDGADKAVAYRNWLGLMTGALTAPVDKGGRTFTRTLDPDRDYTAPDGSRIVRPGRALMLVRNVGHLMTTPAVLDADGREIPEGLLDALVTVLCATHDLRGRRAAAPARRVGLRGQAEDARSRRGRLRRRGVRPRRGRARAPAPHREARHHGRGAPHHRQPRRVHPRGLRPRRVHQHRVPRPHRRRDPHVDARRADGAQARHARQRWIAAYEDWNVDIGLACGLRGRAQIGKGMWAAPGPDGRHARHEDRPPQRRGELRLGPLAHGRDAARDALPPGRRRRPPGCAGRGRRRRQPAGDARRPAADPAGGRVDGATRRSRPSWTTTPRASWATSCAGSTRASGARRCPTSTTSR